jgi:BirA family transcriptional regulator, biotin operon repressor / biotin---[acetyl-CoA-carboxylase] ligase
MVMTSAPDQLSIPRLRRHLDTEVVGHHIYLLGTVESTSTVLRRLAEAGAEAGTVVLAEAQTAGRSRTGARWFSPDSANLYVSVLFRPTLAARDVAVFAPIASLAMAEAVEAENLDAEIRWPNDVVVNGRKVAGTRVECGTVGDQVSHVVLGVGANLNVSRADLESALGRDEAATATSVSELTGAPVDRNAFTARFLGLLEKWHRVFVTEGPDVVLAAWRARGALRDRALSTLRRDDTEDRLQAGRHESGGR